MALRLQKIKIRRGRRAYRRGAFGAIKGLPDSVFGIVQDLEGYLKELWQQLVDTRLKVPHIVKEQLVRVECELVVVGLDEVRHGVKDLGRKSPQRLNAPRAGEAAVDLENGMSVFLELSMGC